jgi:hypothetical protein
VRRALTALAATGLMVALVGLARSVPASASWGDTGSASSGTIASYSVPAAVISSCNVTGNALTGFTARISWTAVTSPHALTYTATIVNLGTPLTVQSSGTTRYVDVQSGLLSTLLGTVVTVQVVAKPPGAGLWVSPPAQQGVLVALLGVSMSCV